MNDKNPVAPEDKLANYLDAFDVVVLDDGPMDAVTEILRLLLVDGSLADHPNPASKL